MAFRLNSQSELDAFLGATARLATKRRKFRNTPVEVDGVRFDSKLEAKYYAALQLREKAGDIRNLRRQVTFALDVNGQTVCAFRADFVFEERAPVETLWGEDERWVSVVADCKSPVTRREPAYRIKSKLMKAVHGITIREVMATDI